MPRSLHFGRDDGWRGGRHRADTHVGVNGAIQERNDGATCRVGVKGGNRREMMGEGADASFEKVVLFVSGKSFRRRLG